MTMKKVFMILATIAMVCTVSCKKDNKKDKPAGGGGEEESAIVIDGKFADWTALGNKVSVATVAEEANYPYLLTLKGYADEDNLYLYFEYELVEDQTASALDILINSDNNGLTGFSSWIWGDGGCGWEHMIESENGFLNGATAYKEMDDCVIYRCKTWKNAAGEQLDAWGDGAEFEAINATWDDAGANVTRQDENAGVVANGIATFEMSIPRSIILASSKGSLAVGVTATNVVDGDWVTAGILPLDEGVGAGAMLSISLP